MSAATHALESKTHKLPSSMELKLQSVRWRHASLIAGRAIALASCVLLALMLVSMLIGWLFPFMDPFYRIAMTAGTLASAVVALWYFAAGPLRNALGWDRVALAVDRELPELEERWATVANLATRNGKTARTPTARAMEEQVASEAVALEQLVSPARIAPPASIRPALLLLLGCFGLLSLLYFASPLHMSVLLRRFWTPAAKISATQITSSTGDKFVPRGEKIELVSKVTGVPRGYATLSLVRSDGEQEDITLRSSSDSPNEFSHSLRVQDTLTYRVRCGDGETFWYRLEAVDYPDLDEVKFAIDFPDYTGRETVVRDRIPKRVKVVQGSKLSLSLKPLDPLEKLTLALRSVPGSEDKANRAYELTLDEDGSYRFETWLVDDLILEAELFGQHGLKNLRRLFSRIDVIEDKAPIARVTTPSANEAVGTDDEIEIKFEAHDDHGIAKAELVVYDESERDEEGNPRILDVKEIPLDEQELQKHLLGKTTLDMRELDVPAGSEISFAVRVTDNRDVVAERSSVEPPAKQTPAPSLAKSTEAQPTKNEASANRELASSRKPNANESSTPKESLAESSDPKQPEYLRQDTEDLVAAQNNPSTPRTPQPNDGQSSSNLPSLNASKRPSSPSNTSVEAPPRQYAMQLQQSPAGQNTLTARRKLRVTERLAAIARADDPPSMNLQLMDAAKQIEQKLERIEEALRQLVDHNVPDADRGEQIRRLDEGLGDVETYVARLREETRDGQFAFVGLQMVDITRTHITPARDQLFAAKSRPDDSDPDANVALEHIVRARELLTALIRRYDTVARERKLQRNLDETIKMYEVFLKKRRMILREAMQNRNPLSRKVAAVTVDQEYLDRLAEVARLRREMLDEFARMLGDDPRLLSRYMEMVQRRGKSFRHRLSEIAERQYEATDELMGWLEIEEANKPDFWTVIIEMRLESATQLARDAAQLSERIKKQMPLNLDSTSGTSATTIRLAEQVASLARKIDENADEFLAELGESNPDDAIVAARGLPDKLTELRASLDHLQFQNEGNEAIEDFLTRRILETNVVTDASESWTTFAQSFAEGSYAGIINKEQHQLAVETQLLRVEMLDMAEDLNQEFQQVAGTDLPDEIAGEINELHHLMEAITFNQAAAAFRAGKNDVTAAAKQQQLATQRMEEAEALFDKVRRSVADELDEYDPDDPNIADLEDPTLDQFLADLEREPNFLNQIGIPNRQQNIRVIADSVMRAQNTAGPFGASAQMAAAARERLAMNARAARQQNSTQQQERARQQQRETQQELERALAQLQRRVEDPQAGSDDKQRLQEMATKISRLLGGKGISPERLEWEKITQADHAKAILAAIARGEMISKEPWNKLLSTLDEGLWQVRGKQPPEAYRTAIEQYQDQIRDLLTVQE